MSKITGNMWPIIIVDMPKAKTSEQNDKNNYSMAYFKCKNNKQNLTSLRNI